MMHYLLDSGETLAAFAAVAGLLSIHPITRKLGYVLIRYGKRHAPKWAVVLMVAPIPGPVDEIAAIVGIVWTFRNVRNRRIFRRYIARALA